jgi:hypothetical protein
MNELQTTIAQKINETFAEAAKLADIAKGNATAAILKAAECGNYIIEARSQVGSNHWTEWLANHAPSITPDIAKKYAKLAKCEQLELALADANSQRDAMRIIGLLPSSARDGDERRERDDSWLSPLVRIVGIIQKTIDHRPVQSWPEIERLTFLDRARPIAKAFVEAGGKL